MISQGLAANGAKVYITGRRIAVLENVSSLSPSNQVAGILIPYGCFANITQAILINMLTRLPMDVTDKESILKARDIIAEKEGKLHILVNKLVTINILFLHVLRPDASPQCGPSWPCI